MAPQSSEMLVQYTLCGYGLLQMKKKKSTILLMMLDDICRTLTKCREGEDILLRLYRVITNVVSGALVLPSFCE